jgi:thioredoxin reductase (NADPH)
MRKQQLTILGSGPAGLTAAIYAGRAGLKPLVVHGTQAGGQLTTTTAVENYPGFADAIMGPDLMDAMQKQAAGFETEFLYETAESVDLSKRPFVIKAGADLIETDALIIASGASSKLLGLPAEKALMGKGVSVCATCDGFFFKGKKVFVVGGGDAALEEAITLTRFASSVTVIHRRDQFRASKIMIDRAKATPKLDFILDSVVEDIPYSEKGTVTAIKIKNIKTGTVQELAADGIFIAIGHVPNTQLFKSQLNVNELGYLVTDGVKTNIDGVFAAGDVHDWRYRQAVVAAGDGCIAALEAQWFLEKHPVQKPEVEPQTQTKELPAAEEQSASPAAVEATDQPQATPPASTAAEETTDQPQATPAAETVSVSEATEAHAEGAETFTVEVTETDFDEVVLKSGLPIVVDCWAAWCGPCMAIAPKIEAIAKEYHGKLVIAKLEIAKDPAAFERFGLVGIPTLILYKNGVEVKRLSGQEPMQQLRQEFDNLIALTVVNSDEVKAAKAELDAATLVALRQLGIAKAKAFDEIAKRFPESTQQLVDASQPFEAEVDRRVVELKEKFDKGMVSEAEYFGARVEARQQVDADPQFASQMAAYQAAMVDLNTALAPHMDDYMALLNKCDDDFNASLEPARKKYEDAFRPKL